MLRDPKINHCALTIVIMALAHLIVPLSELVFVPGDHGHGMHSTYLDHRLDFRLYTLNWIGRKFVTVRSRSGVEKTDIVR